MDIVTLTLNPCIDRTLWVESYGAPPARTQVQTGGKGVNVARVLGNLGIRAAAVCPLGGETGEQFAAHAKGEGIALYPVAVGAPTRVIDTHARIGDMDQRVTYARGGALTESELDAIEARLFACLPGARALAICGSASTGEAAARIPGIIERARTMGVATLLDANGDALRAGLAAKPDIVKPNQAELFWATGIEDDIARAAAQLIQSGIPAVLASMGKAGCAYIAGDIEIYCPAPKVDAVNPVGSGDSFVAGFLYASLKGYALETSLMIACAAGAANAAVFPAARMTKNEIEALLGWALL
jgi:1-phosphofructokinase family hexose kinase